MKSRVHAVLIALLSIVVLAVAGCSSSSDDADPSTSIEPGKGKPMRILLTNDDGYAAPGINVLYRKLTAAGHDVTMVAPVANQSGQGGAMVLRGKIEVTHPTGDPKVYAVTATPATAMMMGVTSLLNEAPDLVISGINSGSNSGFDVLASGTVGAALAAGAFRGIPSIATSLAKSSDDEADYEGAADLIADILDRGVNYLKPGLVLNMNYPGLAAAADRAKDVVYADLTPASGYDLSYRKIDDTTYEAGIAPVENAAAEGDQGQLAKGNATLTLLNADMTVTDAQADTIKKLADELG